MRLRTSLPRSIRPQETPTSAHLGDAKERPCSRRRHGRRGGPAHLAKGRRGAPFRPRSPQSFSEDPASHWVHVQTSTSIDSSVSTLCLRTRVATGPQSRSAGLALTDTLLPPGTASVRERLPPRGSRPCGCDLPSGGGRVGPRDRRVAAGAAGRADSEVWGVPRRCLSRDETARTHHQPESLPRTVLDTRQLLRWWVSSGIHLG